MPAGLQPSGLGPYNEVTALCCPPYLAFAQTTITVTASTVLPSNGTSWQCGQVQGALQAFVAAVRAANSIRPACECAVCD